MSLDSWQSTVAAARKQGKSLYLVNHKAGGTVEATTQLDAARLYVREAARPHLYVIYEQAGRYLYEVT